MSYEGVFEFYRGRIDSAPSYGFKAGHQLLDLILRCAYRDDMLTQDEITSIIKLCDKAHIKMMEDNYNDGWNQQNP